MNERYYIIIGDSPLEKADPLEIEILISDIDEGDFPVYLAGRFIWTSPLSQFEKKAISQLFWIDNRRLPEKTWLDQPTFDGLVG